MAGKASQQLVGNFDGIFRRQVDYTLRGVDEGNRSIKVTASTNTVDSHGDIVEQDFRLDRYRKNPVILFNHHNFDSSTFSLGGAVDPSWLIPIGRAEDVGVTNGSLEATIVFATEKVSKLAENVYQAFREKMMSAVSIGFRPHKITEEKLENGSTRYRLSQNELFEISAVPMPSNPDAVAKSLRLEHDWIRHGYFKKSTVGYTEYPILDTESWDSDDALARVRKWASVDGSGDPDKINFDRYKEAFSWVDVSNPNDLNSYKGLHHDVNGIWLYSSKGGLVALGNALQGSRAGLNIPADDIPEIKKHLEKHYEQFGMTAPWQKSAAIEIVTAEQPNRNNEMDLEKMKAELEAKLAEVNTLKAQAALADEKFKAVEARAVAAETQVKDLETALATEKTASEKLEKEFKAASDKVTALEAKNAEVVIEGYVGKKLTPAEKQEHLDLVKDLGLDRVEKILKARPDITITDPVEIDEKVNKPAPVTPEDPSAELVDMANKAVKK